LLLWGPDCEHQGIRQVLERAHTCVLWNTVNRMVDQLLAGQPRARGANPLDHAGKLALMRDLKWRLEQAKAGRKNYKAEADLFAEKTQFGKCLRGIAREYLARIIHELGPGLCIGCFVVVVRRCLLDFRFFVEMWG